MAGYYDPNKDYSKELQRTDLSSTERSRLETERQNKINDKYGGVEPNMIGSNKTYSQTYGGSSSKSSGSSGGSTALTKGPGYVTGGYDTSGVYGTPTLTKNPYYNSNLSVADMSRRPDLAGSYAISNGYTVFYDENGYATKAKKGVVDYTPHQDFYVKNGSYSGGSLWTDEEMLSAADLAKIAQIRAGIGTQYTGDQANALANQIRSGYGYTIDKAGNVTDLGALSRVDQRRREWGLDANDPTAAQQNFLNLWNASKSGGDIDIFGRPNQPSAPTIDYDALLSQLAGGYGGDYGGAAYPGSSAYGAGAAPTYQGSEWDAILDSLAQELVNMNYADWTQGDQYQALASRYGQQGRMSMQDVLGQISSRTGGLASSYATSAAQQSYNDYMAQLEQAAMEMYNVERGDLLEEAQMARQYAEDDYNRYLDEYNQWAANRDFAYGAYRDSVADQQYADQLAYQQLRDQISDARYEQEYADSIAARDQAALMDQAELLAAYGDFSGYSALGYNADQIAMMQAAYQAANTPKASSGSRSSGSSSSGSKKPTLTAAQTLAALKDGVVNDTTRAAYEYYYGEPWATDTGGVNSTAPISDYGSSYSSIWKQARDMFDSGKTEDSIAAYLNRFSEDQLTDTGLEYILKSLNLGGYR